MLNYKIASAAGVLLGLMLVSNAGAQAQCTAPSTVVEGNKTVKLCLSTSSGTTPRRFSYGFFGSGYRWTGSMAGPPPVSGTINTTVTSGGTLQPYTLTTFNMPFTGSAPSTTNYAQFIYCFASSPIDICVPSPGQKVSFKVDPVVRLQPSARIETNGLTAIELTLGDDGDSPTANAPVEATCTTENGAEISVNPTLQTTNSNGKASFTIETRKLIVYAGPPTGVPKGSCTFKTTGGTGQAEIEVLGKRIYTDLSVTPASVNLPAGSPNHQQLVRVATNPIAENAPIKVLCTGSAGVAVTPTGTDLTLTTDSWGAVELAVTGSNMVVVQPAPPPTASCSFTLGTLQSRTYTLTGVALGQNVIVNPSSFSPLTWTGKAPVVASLTDPYPGYTIHSSCSSSRPDIAVWTVPTSSAVTNTAGQATFEINAPMLGYAEPNLGIGAPSVSCKFWFVPGFETPVGLPTTNACVPSSLSPMPAICGNPQ